VSSTAGPGRSVSRGAAWPAILSDGLFPGDLPCGMGTDQDDSLSVVPGPPSLRGRGCPHASRGQGQDSFRGYGITWLPPLSVVMALRGEKRKECLEPARRFPGHSPAAVEVPEERHRDVRAGNDRRRPTCPGGVTHRDRWLVGGYLSATVASFFSFWTSFSPIPLTRVRSSSFL